MRIRNTDTNYGLIARLLHWLIALLIIALLVLGWWMVDLSYFDRWYHDATEYHKAFGMLVLILVLLKLIWAFSDRAPGFPTGMARWQQIAAKATHHMLIMMMLFIPVSGYLISTSDGKDVSLFGVIDIPALVGKNNAVRDAAIACHFYLAYFTAALVCLHILAALKHQFVNRDGTLARMLWR